MILGPILIAGGAFLGIGAGFFGGAFGGLTMTFAQGSGLHFAICWIGGSFLGTGFDVQFPLEDAECSSMVVIRISGSSRSASMADTL